MDGGGGRKAAGEAWTRKIVDHVMECSGADRRLARLVAHCLASFPSDPMDGEELKGALQKLWKGCIDVWRLLYERKFPEAPKLLYEDVLIFGKEAGK